MASLPRDLERPYFLGARRAQVVKLVSCNIAGSVEPDDGEDAM